MKVLFTGHQGFLGRELIPHLKEDFEIEIFSGDLTNHFEIMNFCESKSIEFIINAAARGGRRTLQDSELTFDNNLKIFKNLAFLQIPLITFCSGAVYGKHRSIIGPTEDDVGKVQPVDPYGRSKLEIWQIAQQLEHVTILRYFNVFGKFEDSNRFMKTNISNSINQKPLIVFQDFVMDFFYVKDSLNILKSILQRNIQVKDLNLVYMKKYSLSEICLLINRITGSNSEIKIVSENKGNDYFGNGNRLNQLNQQLNGLEYGIREFYRHLIID